MNVPDAPRLPSKWPDPPLNLSSATLVTPGDAERFRDSEAPHSSGASSPLSILRKVGLGVLGVIALFYGGCALALLAYNVVDPWTTGVQIQRRLEADASYEKRYDPRPLSALDEDLPLAVVAAEDTRFFQHSGIDWNAIGEALDENRDGDDERRGGSSITQQLVKNLFLTTHSTYFRKAVELPLTYMAELILSKRRILELYLTVIEWGPGIYGAEAAAQYHYGQSAAQLTRYQAAALAACIPNPRVRRPPQMDRYARIILRRMKIVGPLRRHFETSKSRRTVGAPGPLAFMGNPLSTADGPPLQAAARSSAAEPMVPGVGLEPTRGTGPNGFSYHYNFRCWRRGLDFLFTVSSRT